MKFYALRFARLIVVVLVVSFATYLLLDATPGDAATWRLGLGATDEAVEELRAELGLDRPVVARYGDWLSDAFRLDFGESQSLQDVSSSSLIGEALPKTIELMVLAELIAIAIAVPLAIWSAQRPNGLLDRVSSGSAFALLALPAFVLGIYLKYIFGVRLGWFPTIVSDLPGLTEDPLGNLHQMFLPSLTLGLNLVAIYLRILRSDLISTLQEDYVMLAQARGLSARRILWRHALRPSSLNFATTFGLNVAALIGGSLIIEYVFAINGMGRLLIGSVFAQDFTLASSVILVLTIGYVLITFLVDLAYSILDPRIRRAG